jgi:hypothetical protein
MPTEHSAVVPQGCKNAQISSGSAKNTKKADGRGRPGLAPKFHFFWWQFNIKFFLGVNPRIVENSKYAFRAFNIQLTIHESFV